MLSESTKITELKNKYRASFADKIAEIDVLNQAIKSTKARAELKTAHQEYEQYVHKLAGSSGMYGYTEIASVARQLLTVLREDPSLRLRELLTKQLVEALENASTEDV